MSFDVAAYLASKGLRGRAASGGRELIYPCWFDCGEPASSNKRKLYVNVSEGLYHCKVCGTSGGPFALQQHFGDTPATSNAADPFMRRRILDKATERGQEILRANDDALLYLLNDRGFTPDTIERFKLGFVAGGWSLADAALEIATREQLKDSGLVHRDGPREGRDFFYRHLLIPLLSRGHTIQIRGRAWGEVKGGKYFTPPGDPPRVFNADALDGAETVIVTEGELDAIALTQALENADHSRARGIAVVGLPGTNAIPEEFDDITSAAKWIYVGFDSDEPGQRAAKDLKERIGTRGRILTLPYYDGRKCDWTEFLLPAEGPGTWKTDHPYAGHSWQDVMRLLSSADGKQLRSVAEARINFFNSRAENDGLLTGYRRLDARIKPGLLPGQVMILLAKTGTGKTVWLCNLAYNMRQYRVLIVSLEMTHEEIYDRLRRIYLFHHPRASYDDIDRELRSILICDANRLGAREMANLVAEYTLEIGAKPDVVMIDYLGYFARSAPGNSPYEKVTNAVMALKEEAKAGRFVVISPAQVNRVAKEGRPIDLDDARDSGAVEETADFLLALYRPDDTIDAAANATQQPTGKLRLAILKSRHGGKGHTYSLQMDLLTLAIVDDDIPAARRASENTHLAWLGRDWEYLRALETAPQQMTLPTHGAPTHGHHTH